MPAAHGSSGQAQARLLRRERQSRAAALTASAASASFPAWRMTLYPPARQVVKSARRATVVSDRAWTCVPDAQAHRCAVASRFGQNAAPVRLQSAIGRGRRSQGASKPALCYDAVYHTGRRATEYPLHSDIVNNPVDHYRDIDLIAASSALCARARTIAVAVASADAAQWSTASPSAKGARTCHLLRDPLDTSTNIDALLQETRRFPPSADFAAQANVRDPSVYQRAHDDPEGFWAEAANRLDWFKRWDKVLEWDAPWAKWFVGGKLNASYNCVDRHMPDLAPQQSRHHLGGRAGRHARADLSRSVPRGQPASPPCCWIWASRRATASPSTCR